MRCLVTHHPAPSKQQVSGAQLITQVAQGLTWVVSRDGHAPIKHKQAALPVVRTLLFQVVLYAAFQGVQILVATLLQKCGVDITTNAAGAVHLTKLDTHVQEHVNSQAQSHGASGCPQMLLSVQGMPYACISCLLFGAYHVLMARVNAFAGADTPVCSKWYLRAQQ